MSSYIRMAIVALILVTISTLAFGECYYFVELDFIQSDTQPQGQSDGFLAISLFRS